MHERQIIMKSTISMQSQDKHNNKGIQKCFTKNLKGIKKNAKEHY